MSWDKDVFFAVVDDIYDVNDDKRVNLTLKSWSANKPISCDYYLTKSFTIPRLYAFVNVAYKRNFLNQSKKQLESFSSRFDATLKDLRGKVVCLRAAINTKSPKNEFLMRDNREGFSRGKEIITDDWYITELISLDIEYDIENLIKSHKWSEKPSLVTKIPIFEYLVKTYKCQEINLIGLPNYLHYELEGSFFHISRVEGHGYSSDSEYSPTDDYFFKTDYSNLITVNPEPNENSVGNTKKLSYINAQLIFDKFFRPIRSLPTGRSQEKPRIYHFLNFEMNICRYGYEERVTYRSDDSRDWSVEKIIVVMRIGDELSSDMQNYLRNPIGYIDDNINGW